MIILSHKKNRAPLYFWKTDFWNSHGEGGERGRLVRVRNYFLKLKFVGNKANGWISKRVFQENKAYQIFRQTNISYPLIRCVSGGKKFLFFGKFDVPCFLEKSVLRFTILSYYRRIVLGNWNYCRSWVYLFEKICPAVAISVKNIISKQQFTSLVHLKKKWKVIEVHLHTKFRKKFINWEMTPQSQVLSSISMFFDDSFNRWTFFDKSWSARKTVTGVWWDKSFFEGRVDSAP